MNKIMEMSTALGGLGRPLAHLTFSAMFVYDLVFNGNSFGWDNAGIYAVSTFGGEALLAYANIRFNRGGRSTDVNPVAGVGVEGQQ